MSAYLKIIINSDSDAFSSDPHGEAIRILREIADNLSEGFTGATILDINGNSCGSISADFVCEN